jgi:hypothetical protein
MTVVAMTPRTPERLPAAPLLQAVWAERNARGLSIRKILSPTDVRAYQHARTDGWLTLRMAARLCAALDRDPREPELYGESFQEPPVRGAYEPHGQSRVRLPAAPLLKAINRRLGATWTTLFDADQPSESLEEQLGGDGHRAYTRMVAEGTATLHTIEKICDLFGWHPYQVYGAAYDEAAFKGAPADFDPWEGVAA